MTYNVFSGTLNPTHFTSKQLSRIAHVKRGSNRRSLSLAPAQTGWRKVATQVQCRLSVEQLERCEAVGATLRATSRATSTGTRKQTRTRTQTNQLKGKRGIWTWVREPSHDRVSNGTSTDDLELSDLGVLLPAVCLQCLHMNRKAYTAFNFNSGVKTEGKCHR